MVITGNARAEELQGTERVVVTTCEAEAEELWGKGYGYQWLVRAGELLRSGKIGAGQLWGKKKGWEKKHTHTHAL